LIVMKFGGTSVADAERILAVAGIIEEHRASRPVVVLSAIAGVTDLLESAVASARGGDRDGLEETLDAMERKHRWALSGTVRDARVRHDLTLEVDRQFEDLRQLLRSVRILGEGTPRAADALLAFGELLSSRIACAAFSEGGLPVQFIDPRDVMITDRSHGSAEPEMETVRQRCNERLRPLVEAGRIPVIGGFVGASGAGETTTLGRGGSDTSAAVIGAALEVEEIQIWSDVPGLMTADPRAVPEAKTLDRISFAEAAELAYYGARVLHPSSIAPAVRRAIPVRVLSSLDPGAPGTVVLEDPGDAAPDLASVASRSGVAVARITGAKMRADPGFLLRVLGVLERSRVRPDLVVSSEVGVSLVVPQEDLHGDVVDALSTGAVVDVLRDRSIICVVGSGLASKPEIRSRVLGALEEAGPEIVSMGGTGFSVSAIVPVGRLHATVRDLHRRFFE
jgi:aspartate kinase